MIYHCDSEEGQSRQYNCYETLLLVYHYILITRFFKFVARENEVLKMMAMTKPELYLDEYKDWFKEITGKQISISTICRSIIRLGFTYKKVKIYCNNILHVSNTLLSLIPMSLFAVFLF